MRISKFYVTSVVLLVALVLTTISCDLGQTTSPTTQTQTPTQGAAPEDYTFQGGAPYQSGSPTGTQNPLIIFVRASDDTTANLATLRTSEEAEFTDVSTFFDESSFGQISFNYDFAPSTGWYQLTNTYDDYMWTQADINAAPAGSAARQKATDNINTVQDPNGLFTEALQEAQDDGFNVKNYDTVVVVIIGPFNRCASYWPGNYTLKDSKGKDFQVYLPIVIVSTFTGWSRTAHEFGHAFGHFPDAYYSASRRPGNWEIMDCTDCGAQTTGWNKDVCAEWYTDPPHDSKIKVITRPTGMQQKTDTTTLIPYETENAPANSIQTLRLDAGGGVSLYVENRQTIAGQTGSQNLPANGIIITDAIDLRNVKGASRDCVCLFGGPLFSGDIFTDQSYGDLKIEVSGTAPNLQVKTTWGPDPYVDLRITPWEAPPWESADIWVDSPANGWDVYEYSNAAANPLVAGNPVRNGDKPLMSKDNRIYARVYNDGTKDVSNVTVSFFVTEPQGIGTKDTTWSLIDRTTISVIPKESYAITAPISWKPRASTHTCLRVLVDYKSGELNANNNEALENISTFNTTSSSPWRIVESEVLIENPTDLYQDVRIEMTDIPDGWSGWVSERFVALPPGGSKLIQYRINPGLGGGMDVGSEADINIVGYIMLDDHETLLGGITSTVRLVQKSEVSIDIPETISRGDILEGYTANAYVSPEQEGLPVALIITQVNAEGELMEDNYAIISDFTDALGNVRFSLVEAIERGELAFEPGESYVLQVHLYGSQSIDSSDSPRVTVHIVP